MVYFSKLLFRFERTRQIKSITHFGLDEIEIVRVVPTTTTLRPTAQPSTSSTIQSVTITLGTTTSYPLEYACDFDVDNCGSTLSIGVTQIGSDAFFGFVNTTVMSGVTVTDVTSISIY